MKSLAVNLDIESITLMLFACAKGKFTYTEKRFYANMTVYEINQDLGDYVLYIPQTQELLCSSDYSDDDILQAFYKAAFENIYHRAINLQKKGEY